MAEPTSPNRTGGPFQGIRREIKDTTQGNKLHETEAAAKNQDLVKQQVAPVGAPKAQEDFSLNLSKV
jgi:hypothetical protein